MGGDIGPRVNVAAAALAAREGIQIILVGDEAVLRAEVERLDAGALPMSIRHASQVVEMEEKPSEAMRRKKDSSIQVACQLVKDGEADGVVSAGNSGASVACGMFVLGRIKGVERPALASIMPTEKSPVVLIDVGANVDSKPYNLAQFAIMVCGGAESTVTPLSIAGFNALKALSTRNDAPELASRPFDAERDGFVLGEGCGLLLLESLDHAKKRGATILAELVGCGASGDAYHMTAPPEDGRGMALAMRKALEEAGVAPADVDHINAHATSTKLNDLCETRAIKSVFGPHAYDIAICGNKGQMGHLLGAAGGVEAVFSVKTIVEGVIPGTINRTTPDPECDLDYCVCGPREQKVAYALSNSFGFGGTNGCLLFKRFTD